MQNFKFHKIIIQGFGSCRTLVFSFDQGGLTFLKGANGAGKSTVFNALVWCMYGKHPKGITATRIPTWEKYRLNDFKGTRVIVTGSSGEHDYMFARHLKFKGTTKGITAINDLLVFKTFKGTGIDSTCLIEENHKGESQEYIEKLLGMGVKAFMNCVFFAQNTTRLLQEKGNDKRELFTRLFDMAWADACKDKAKAEMTTVTGVITDFNLKQERCTAKISELESKIEQGQLLLGEFQQTRGKRADEKESQLNRKKQDLQRVEDALNNRQDVVHFDKEKYDALQSKIKESDARKNELWEKINRFKLSVNNYSLEIKNNLEKISKGKADAENIETHCPTCEKPLTKTKIKNAKDKLLAGAKELEKANETLLQEQGTIKTNLSELESDFEDCKQELAGYKGQSETLEKAKESNTDEIRKVAALQADKKTYSKAVLTLTDELKAIREEQPPSIDIASLKLKLKDYRAVDKKIKETLSEKTKEKERLSFWITTGFSSKGVKAFVFNSMLNKLNQLLHDYANRLGIKVTFSVDLQKASKPFVTKVELNGVEVLYEELSGGQQGRVNAIVMFAMYDLVGKGRFNIMLLDEPFAGMDAEGIESFFEMLQMKIKEGVVVWCVTHRVELDAVNAKSIYLKMSNGLTMVA